MIDIEPPALEFRDVRLNQAYSTSLCLTNPLSGAVDITLKASSPRYTISPARLTLNPGVQGHHEDFISIKSLYFEQKVDITLFLHKRDITSRSQSPHRTKLNDSSSKDAMIQQLQEANRQLQEKYPDFQQLLDNRLAMERQIFEEKSEKILHILKTKDEQIADLEKQVQQCRSDVHAAEPPPPPPPQQSRPDPALLSTQKRLRDALKLNDTLRHQLTVAEKQIETLKNATAASMTGRERGEETRAISRLQEKVIDQAEQIEVLVQEITQLRAGEVPSVHMTAKHKTELANMQHHIYDLRQEVDRLQAELTQRPQCVTPRHTSLLTSHRLHKNTASAAVQCDSSPDVSSWISDDGLNLDRGSTLYKERAEQAEHALEVLQQQYNMLLLREQDTNAKWHESQQYWEEIAVRQTEISEREEALREKEEHLSDREKTLHHMLGSVSDHSGKEEANREGSLPDAHAWWAYVYHEMKRQHQSHDAQICNESDDDEEEDTNKQQSLIEQQKNTIRSQALEVATLRQDILMKNMKYKQQLEALKDENARYQRDNFKLHSYISAHRGDREIKINELQTTIRLMSSRSDLHQALAAARQELEDEKLVVHHLRADIDAYRSLLEEEHNKIVELRRTLQIAQNELNASEVAKSIITVPGANAVMLIELFSGRLMFLQEEIARLQSSSATSPAKKWQSNARSINGHGNNIDPEGEEYEREINVVLSKATPDTLPDVLDSVLLARKVQQLTFMLEEQKIALQATTTENNELHQQLQELQGPQHEAWHKYNDRLLIQRNEFEKRYEICHCKFEEAMHELEIARKRVTELENDVHNLQEKLYIGTRQDASEAPQLSDDSVSTLGEDEVKNMELREVKELLRERTVQLKVLMETLDVLQLGGRKSGMLNISPQELAEELSGQWERGGDVWGLQALVTRVVDLTAEVGSNTSTIHALKKQIKQTEKEKTRALHDYHQALNSRKTAEDAVSDMQVKLEAISGELRARMKLCSGEISELRKQCSALQEKLRESESSYREVLIRYDSLKAQINVDDASALEKCMSELFCDQQTLQFQEVRNDRDDVKQLIVTLLVQWRDQVGFYPRAASGPISKAEQKFLNRVTKLVLEAHDRCHKLEVKLTDSENRQALSDARYELSRKLLASSISMLHRYRCRVNATERIPAIDELYLTRSQARSDVLLKNEIASLQDKLEQRNNAWICEKRRHAELAAKFTLIETSNKKLKAHLVQIESNMRLPRYSEEAVNVDDKLRAFELQLYKWFKVELPRLLTGVPVEENQYQTFNGRNITSLAQELGIEKTYALSQALCSAKTEQATLEAQLQSSRELTAYYKERVMSLENVIYRWQSEFDGKGEEVLSSIRETQVSHGSTREMLPQLEEENKALQGRVKELEERLIESSSQFEHVRERSDALKQVVDTLRQENLESKQEHALHLNQVRHELSEKYIMELRDIREAYEMEKNALAGELQKFAEEIHSAEDGQTGQRVLSQSSHSTPQSRSSHMPRLVNISSSHTTPLSASGHTRRSTPDETNESSHSHTSSSTRRQHTIAAKDVTSTEPLQPSPESSSSPSTDSMIQSLPHEIGLWTQIARTSTSEMPSVQPPPARAPPSKQPDSDDVVNYLRRQVEALSNDVLREKHAATAAREQVRELEELLEKQRESFRHHLDMERDVAMITASTSQIEASRRGDEFSVSTGTSDSRPQQMPLSEKALPTTSQETVHTLNALDTVLTISANEWPTKQQFVIACVRRCSQLLRRVATSSLGRRVDEQCQPSDVPSVNLVDRATSPTPSSNPSDREPIGPLSERIRVLERELLDEYHNPDLSILRELKDRVSQLETQDSANLISGSYAKALREAQEALDQQIEVSREQCEKLAQALENERSRVAALSEQLQYSMQENERLRKQISASDSSLEGVAKMQQLLSTVTDELDASKKAARNLQAEYESKLQNLQNHFLKFEAAQTEIVQSLELQLKQAQDASISEMRQHMEKNVGLSDEEIECAVLAKQIQCKRAELNSVLRALIAAGATCSDGEKGCETESSTDVMRMRETLMQARLTAADKELEVMSREIAKERAALHAVTAKAEKEEQVKTSPAEEAAADPNDKLKSLARRANNMRRQYMNEIDGLKSQLATLKESETTFKNETNKLKTMIFDYKDQISVLREDNARKAKLVSTLKSHKSSEANAIEQYRNENSELDEKCKRLQRALISKEEIIKDLRSKQHVAAAAAESDNDGDGGDVTTLTPLDLRKRVKALELERGRMRARLAACKEKIEELETRQKRSAVEEEQSSQLNEKIENLKLTLSRKEILIKSYKEQIEKMKVEILSQKEIYESHRSDFEKQIRSLQRQIDFGEKRYHDFASEYEKMKERLTSNFEEAEEKSAKLKQALEITLEELDRRPEEPPVRPLRGVDVSDISLRSSGTPVSHDELEDIMSALRTSKEKQRGSGTIRRSRGGDLEGRIAELLDLSGSSRSSTSGRSEKSDIVSVERRLKKIVASALEER